MSKLNFAIQLYSVRQELAEDFPGTLDALRKIGFEAVELAFFYGGMQPEALAKLLAEKSLPVCGIYEKAENLADPKAQVYAYAKALNCRYLTLGFSQESLQNDFQGCLALLKDAVRSAAENHCQVCYHAHAHEFAKLDQHSYLEHLLNETEGLLYEADTAWIHAGGEKVVPHLQQWAKIIPLLHLKDLDENGKITELGNGVIDFAAVIQTARKHGLHWLSYEQDYSSMGALKSAEVSHQLLREIMTA